MRAGWASSLDAAAIAGAAPSAHLRKARRDGEIPIGASCAPAQSGQFKPDARSCMAYGAELNRAGGWLDEPDHGKKCADRGGPGHRLGVVAFGERWSSDIERKLDAVAVIGRQVAKI